MPQKFKPRYFNPGALARAVVGTDGDVALRLDDATAYVYSTPIILAVNVAMATGRPLLVAGSPGTGKTTLAANVAKVLGWKFYPRVITSRTRAQDLMWKFDALRRLSDAQASTHSAQSLRPRAAYLEPQALWWAFDAESAARRGAAPAQDDITPASDPQAEIESRCSVVLLDEIDKAEPDVPNDLLEALDAERFTVEALDAPLQVCGRRERVLMMITTNGERELPAAFMRRCVVLKLEPPTVERLVEIANDRFGAKRAATHRAIAERVVYLRRISRQQNLREPSTAEYLDALAACARLHVDHHSPRWALLEQSLLWKRDLPLPGAAMQ